MFAFKPGINLCCCHKEQPHLKQKMQKREEGRIQNTEYQDVNWVGNYTSYHENLTQQYPFGLGEPPMDYALGPGDIFYEEQSSF